MPSFSRVTFADGSATPAINATNLNAIETFLQAISDGGFLSPTGTVNPFAGATTPTGWLLCDGSAVSRTTYAALLAIIGTTYGSGDGSTTFNLPDLRETTIVGVGTRGSGVTAHDTYTLGQFMDDQVEQHVHVDSTNGSVAGPYGSMSDGSLSRVDGSGLSTVSSGNKTSGAKNSGGTGVARTGTTTHGKQMGMNWIIKT